MPKIAELPHNLRPFAFHGLDINWKEGEAQASAACPWCGDEEHFSIKVETGQWACFKCQQGNAKGGGNALTFIQMLWDESDKATRDYEEIRSDRRLLRVETLEAWGVCRSILSGEWLIPGYSVKGRLVQLYVYRQDRGGRFIVQATPARGSISSAGLFGRLFYDERKRHVYLCEGCWDGMALWETMKEAKPFDGHLQMTASHEDNLLADINVLAVPGCSIFEEGWLPLFADKVVMLLYDNDYPRINPKTGEQMAPGALQGMRKAAEMLSGAKQPPAEIRCVKWGPAFYNLDLPSGYDVRDLLTKA